MNMKKLALLLSALLVAGVASAQSPDAPKPQSDSSSKSSMSAGKTHTVEVEVVSADASGKTLTVKGDTGNKTVTVDDAAAAELKSLKAGDKVKLTCRDNDKGEHQAITKIEKSS